MRPINFVWLKKCIEIPIVLFCFGYSIIAPVTTNFIIYRTCYAYLSYNQSDCEKLGSNNESNATHQLEKKVEPDANVIMMTQSLVEQIVPALLCLFLGPWTDKHGRKPVLISTAIGFTISDLISIVIVLLPKLSPWYLLLRSVPAVLLGGYASHIMVILCYISDITAPENRSLRIGIYEAVLVFGMFLGTLLSSYIFDIGGYITVYTTATVCHILASAYIIFILSESIVSHNDEDKPPIFSTKNIKNMLHTTFKRRQNYIRSMLLIAIGMATIFTLANEADSSVFFLFLREKFEWSLEKYTLFSGLRQLVWIVGKVLGLSIFYKVLQIPESPLLLIGFFAYLCSVLLQAFAIQDWYIYLAAAIRSIAGVVSPLSKALVSKLVCEDEIGKIFATTIFIQTIYSMIGGPLYTLVYNYTLDFFPGAFNLITTSLIGIEILFVIIFMVLQRISLNANAYKTLVINSEQ